MTWAEFCDEWVRELKEEGVLVGVNWSGKWAVGYDLDPGDLKRNVEAVIANPQ